MSQHGCPERLSNRSKGFQEDVPSQQTMEVLVETLTGTAFEMTVSPSDTILAIKSKIFRVEGIPVSQQHILYNLKELDDSSSLRSHAITDGARLRLVLGMRVGPISTRRLPPPPNSEPWRDIERLLDSNREESEWSSSPGCRVTVLVLRDGGRVNLLRVRQNSDGTYCPIDNNKYSSSLTLAEQDLDEDVADSVHDNEVTMGKMIDLRRRMENLSVQKRKAGNKQEIQKTRSEESLSIPSLLDDASTEPYNSGAYTYTEGDFAPMYDGNYTRYQYDCSFADRYTLLPPLEWSVTPNLPPIGTRTNSEPVQEPDDRLKLSDALAGSILVQGRREREEEGAILEECLDSEGIREGSPQMAAKIPAAEYGPLVCGSGSAWRAWGPPLPPPPSASLQSLSALRSLLAGPPPAAFSSSTSDLEQLRRTRMLPSLSRHRPRSRLHLWGSGLELRPRREVGGERASVNNSHADLNSQHNPLTDHDEYINDFKTGAFNADTADFNDLNTVEVCRDDEEDRFATRSGEAEKVYRFDDYDVKEDLKKQAEQAALKDAAPAPRPPRPRCSFCRKRLSIATEHRCRCGAAFCAPHRYAEVHGCAYDYRARAHALLAREHPRVAAPKLPKI
ncbi:uncharacterized protein LOC106134456 [Amyelois transitella]|uniref:uncharacterized protein LOC106134456 n=1 Tax=Amyelois transitella TaxID=680683 RepID=UPI0029904D9F|nr:uncharacterized protein LOC106134456 [Amyelois transitella]